MSAIAATRRPAKKTYKPFVRIVDRGAGLYTVQSERYTHLLYLCDVLGRTCECEAGQHEFANCTRRPGGVCKHLQAATMFHAAIERSRLGPVGTRARCPECGQQRYEAVDGFCFDCGAAFSPALVARYGGAAGLTEAFGVTS